MLSSLISLLPTIEHGLWIREMTIAQLDFRNPEGLETFNCFKKVCIIERNTNECSRSEPILTDVQTPTAKKTTKSSYKIQAPDKEGSDCKTKTTFYAILGSNTKSWYPD